MKLSIQKQKGPIKPSKNKSIKAERKNIGVNKSFIVAGILLVTLLVFFPMLNNEFTSWDDETYVTTNNYIMHMDAAKVKYIFTHPIANNYHPFTIISLGLNYYLSGLNPRSYFLGNLLLHLIDTALVFYFIFLLSSRNIHIAAFTAILFGIHPMHVESVAWISERKDVLYALFFLAGLICYLFFLDSKKINSKANGKLWYLLTFILSLSAMLSKPAAIVFPIVLIAIDFYKIKKITAASILNKIPFFILAAIFLYLTWIAQNQEQNIVGDFKTYSFSQRILFACYGFIIYLIKFFVPIHLASFHPYPKVIGWEFYIAPLLVAAIVTGIFYFKKQKHLLLFGLFFYTANLLLVLQLISVGVALYADRYSYMPYVGISFVAGTLIFSNQKINIKFLWLLIACCLAFFAYQARAQVKTWHNSETLWTDEIKKYPQSDRGYYDRGNYYYKINNLPKAIDDFSAAINVGTDYKTYSNRGLAFYQLKKYDEAMQDFNTSIKMNSNKNEAYAGRAQLYEAMNQFDKALKDINAALAIKSTYEEYFTRATIYKALKKYDMAIADYNAAAGMTNDVSIFNNRGNIYFATGNYEKAIEDYNKVLNKTSNDYNAITNRGMAFFQLKHFDEAINDFTAGIVLQPQVARNYASRSLAYQQKGDKENAYHDAQKAIQMGYKFE